MTEEISEGNKQQQSTDPMQRSTTEAPDSRMEKQKAALAEYMRTSQRNVAVIVILFGTVGFISMQSLFHRRPNPPAQPSQRAIEKALYEAAVNHLHEEQRREADLEAEAKGNPSKLSTAVLEQKERVRQAKELATSLARKVGVRPPH